MAEDLTEQLTDHVTKTRAVWEAAQPGKAKDRAYIAMTAAKAALRGYRVP